MTHSGYKETLHFETLSARWVCYGYGLGIHVGTRGVTAEDAASNCYREWCDVLVSREGAAAEEAKRPQGDLSLMVAPLRPNGISPLWRK